MIRISVLTLLLVPAGLLAQVGVPGSTRYRTASIGGDVRASWANPAGLASFPEASVMAEFRYDRPTTGGGRLGQFTLGLNSRGFSLIYQKDRFENGNVGSTYRFGVGNPFRSGAIGVAYTLYKGSGPSASAFDIGVRYRPLPIVDIGFVARHLGRPFVRGVTLPATAVGSVSYLPFEHLILSVEVGAAERADVTGYDMSYRGLANLISPAGQASVIGVIEVAPGGSVRTIGIGFSYGVGYQGLMMGALDRTGGATRLGSISVTGVASQQFSQIRR